MLGDLEGNSTPIEVKIFGDDPEALAEASEPVETLLGKIDGVVDVVGMQRGNPELTWNIDPTAAARFGLTVADVTAQLSAAWLGDVSTDLRLMDRRVPVRVRLPDAVRFNPARLSQTLLQSADGHLVPLSAWRTRAARTASPSCMRENLRGMALVTARLEAATSAAPSPRSATSSPASSCRVGYTWRLAASTNRSVRHSASC